MQKLANQPRRLSNRELPALVTQALAGFKVEPKSIQLLRSNIHQTFSIVGANHSGTTFRNSRFVLKIRSSDFRSVKATDEEVRWLEFLSRSPLGCAPPIRTQRGSTSHAFTGRSGERYLALLTRWTFGTNVGSQTRTAAQFVRLGELIGQMHQYGSGFPSQFRNELMPRNFFRANRRVGALSAMKSIGPKDLTVLLEAVRFLKSEFEDYERSTSNKHGFIHGDLYFGNLIVQKDRSYRAIDFDECGYGAFAFDLSTAFRQLKKCEFFADGSISGGALRRLYTVPELVKKRRNYDRPLPRREEVAVARLALVEQIRYTRASFFSHGGCRCADGRFYDLKTDLPARKPIDMVRLALASP